jgi:hypothetical protein
MIVLTDHDVSFKDHNAVVDQASTEDALVNVLDGDCVYTICKKD